MLLCDGFQNVVTQNSSSVVASFSEGVIERLIFKTDTATAGCFFTAGSIFWKRDENLYVLSLGFRSFAALAVPLTCIRVDGKEI